jgi:acetyl-CoA carboxylase biotin carboxylase subunit
MHAMGDKLRAREAAKAAGVPIPPGSEEVDEASAIASAKQIGFPVLIKASAGGGGIGIQVVHSEGEFIETLRRARSLAQNAFGSNVVYLEKFLQGASHIEAQVLGDKHGNVVHLFERDCSMQRRNQKVIEEAPSAKLTDEQRESLLRHAVALARGIGYSNAGTMEFLYKDGQFYFLEMNTRLQVEHPVTEMVTGLDLVELQLRVASGEPLPFQQGDISYTGHAMEARVYAEDPAQGFMPSAGLVTKLHEPADIPNVRIDGYLREGYEVTPFYDPMLAKVIAWGETRSAAIRTLDKALAAYRIEGLTSNIALLRRILKEPAFLTARFSTRTLPEMMDRGEDERGVVPSIPPDPVGAQMAAAAAVAALITAQGNKRAGAPPGEAWRTYGRRMGLLGRSTRGW